MKTKRIVIISLLIFLILLIISVYFFTSSYFLNKNVKTRIEKEFRHQSNGQYSLTIDHIDMSILQQSVVFKGVAIQPNKYNSDDLSYDVSFSDIKFSGLKVLRYIISRKSEVEAINLTNPSLTIYRGSGEKVIDEDTTAFSLYEVIKPFSRSLKISKIEVENFDLKLFKSVSDSTPLLYSNDNYYRIINFSVDKSSERIPGLFKADSIMLLLNNFKYTTNDSLYTFDIKHMKVLYSDSLLLLDSVRVIPNYSKKKFATIAGKQTDRFDIFAKELKFNRIDLRLFFEYYGFKSKSLDITDFSMTAYRDKNDKREFARPESLQSLILNSPAQIQIDTINVINSVIAYEEVAEGKTKPGRITFNKINGHLTGLTNDSLLISIGRNMQFDATCLLMNKQKLNASYTFPLNTSKMVFTCKAYLTDFPMIELNKMIEPITGIKITDGTIDTLSFSFDANDYESNGKIKFVYHNLKINKESDNKGIKKLIDKVTVFVVNNLVIPSGNLDNKRPTSGNMHYVRNKERFMFHYTWHTIFEGIKNVIGITDKKKKE